MPTKNTKFYSLILILADTLVLLAAFTVAYIIRVQIDNRPLVSDVFAIDFLWTALTIVPFWIIIFALIGLYSLFVLIPSIAVQVRRFHDQDKSGWFVLINFVPYIGGIIVLVFMLLEGTRGPNKYGPDPKEGLARGV